MPITHANFSFSWNIRWQDFCDISNKSLTKFFVTPRKNVVFCWHLEMVDAIQGTAEGKFALKIFYDDAPLPELKDVRGAIEVLRADKHYKQVLDFGYYTAKRGSAKEFPNFDEKDRIEYHRRTKKGITYRVTLKIPLATFHYNLENPIAEPRPTWLSAMFKEIENPHCEDSDAQLVSGDERKFYCHRNVLSRQSPGLAAMFRNPSSEEERRGIFRFPLLPSEAMKMILEFFYTGDIDRESNSWPATRIICQVADFGEQFGMKTLKQKCAAYLWRWVCEKPGDAVEILRFADLHDDLTCLKDRAMVLLAEDYDNLRPKLRDFLAKTKDEQADVQGYRLYNEFLQFGLRRLDVWYG